MPTLATPGVGKVRPSRPSEGAEARGFGAPAAPKPVGGGSIDPSPEAVRLGLRIVVQLSRVGPPREDGTARSESTQQGLAEALSVTQSAVSKILSRLVAAEVARAEHRHIPGRSRRVRAYVLTRLGENLAREIEDRLGGAFPMSRRSVPKFPERDSLPGPAA